MACDEGLAQRVREILEDREGVTEKKMFGGLAFLVGGNMCCGVMKAGELMVRVRPDAYDGALSQRHAREMDFTGRPMKGMVTVTSPGVEDDDELASWVGRGLAFAGSLPAK